MNFVYNKSKIAHPWDYFCKSGLLYNAGIWWFFVSDYEKKEGTTAVEVKQEVEMHLKEKDIIEATIPGNIVIGPFWVNTENVKQTLSKKRKNLSNAMLELLARKLRNQADDVSEFNMRNYIFLFLYYFHKVYNMRKINNRNFNVTVLWVIVFLCWWWVFEIWGFDLTGLWRV